MKTLILICCIILATMPWLPAFKKIPSSIHEEIRKRIAAYAATRPWGTSYKLHLHFKGTFCYLGTVEENDHVYPLGRLRYFHMDKWSLDFYTYSNERYEPCFLPNGKQFGSLEMAVEACELYLV
jgi:hypothetical protein